MLSKIKDYLYEKRYYIMGGLAILGAVLVFQTYKADVIDTITSDFVVSAKNQSITKAFVDGDLVIFKVAQNWYRASIDGVPKDQIYQLLSKSPGVAYNFQTSIDGAPLLGLGMVCAGTALLIQPLTNYLTGSGYSLKRPKNVQTKPILFRDVFGNEDIKEKLKEFIDYLKNPTKYKEIGARTRRGILLYGPPGTGKTMIAKATACESGVEFIYCSAAEFQEVYVGVGPKRIRQLFAQARSYPQGCIIFIDEIDAIGFRSNSLNSAEGEKNSTINQLLTQMDGFYQNTNILVIGATNRQNMVDEALLRPGRFDLKIRTCLPNAQQRQGILQIHLSSKKQSISKKTIESVADQTKNYSGAQIQHVVNESAYVCLKQGKSVIQDEHLKAALRNEHKRAIS